MRYLRDARHGWMGLAWCCAVLVSAQTLIDYGYEVDETLAGETDRYRFTTNRGDQVLVRLAVLAGDLDVNLALQGLAGGETCSQVLTTFDPNNPNQQQPTVLEMTCRFTLEGPVDLSVSGWRNRKEGRYRLFLTRLNSPPGIPRQKYGAPVSGKLDNGLELYRFDGSVSDRLLLRLKRTAGQMEPWLRVYDPDGLVLCEDARPSELAQISNCLLDKSGTYTLVVGDQSKTKSGSFDVTVLNLNNPVGLETLELGTTHNDRIDSDVDLFRFEVGLGDTFLARLITETVAFTPEMQILAADGRKLHSVIANPNGVAILENLNLAPGSYTLLVKARNDIGSGDYRLFLTRLNQPPHARQMGYGQVVEGSINRSLELITFEGNIGDAVDVTLQITSGSVQPEVQLLDPEGQLHCVDFNTAGSSANINRCRLSFKGRHTLVLKDVSDTRSGSYQVNLTSSNAQTSSVPAVTLVEPTLGETFVTKSSTLTVKGTFFSPSPVTSLQWRTQTGGSGTAMLNAQTQTWTIPQVNLVLGDNLLTVTARNQLGLEGSDTLRITYQAPTDFERFLLILFDLNSDGVLGATEISAVTEINCSSRNLSSLEGIQQFTNLTSLRCEDNLLTRLPDLSGLPRLKTLHCQKNLLTTLPTLPSSLEDLNCSQNQIAALPNFTQFSALRVVLAAYNRIARLENPGTWPAVKSLDLSHNQLSNLPGLPPALEALDGGFNQLTGLPPFQQSGGLKTVDLRGNQLPNSVCSQLPQRTDLVVHLTPQANNRSLECQVDQTPPVVRFFSPQEDAQFQASTDANGTIEEAGALRQVLIQGENGFQRQIMNPSSSGGSLFDWSFSNIPLVEGQNVITVTAEDSAQNVGVDKVTVTSINGQTNVAPILELEIPISASLRQLFQYTAKGIDKDGDLMTFSWDFDGNPRSGCSDLFEEIHDTTREMTCEYHYAFNQIGSQEVVATVSDGKTTTTHAKTIEIIPNNRPPRIIRELMADRFQAEVGDSLNFTVGAVDDDTDPLIYEWTMNDGTSFQTSIPEMSYVYRRAGVFDVGVSVLDGNAMVQSMVTVDIQPARIPVIGIDGPIKVQIYEGQTPPPKEVFQVKNDGEGVLRYKAVLEIRDRRDLNWAQILGESEGVLNSQEVGILSIEFKGSEHLIMSSSAYYVDMVIVGQEGVDSRRREIPLFVLPPQGKTNAVAHAFGKMVVEWDGAGQTEVDHYRVEAVQFGKAEPAFSQETTETRLALSGLATDQAYRVQITPVLKRGGLGPVQMLENRSAQLPAYPYLSRLNHIANPNNFWTGMALVNPGDRDAKLLLQLLDSGGLVLKTSAQQSLPAGSKLLGLVEEFFEEGIAGAARMNVLSDQPLATLELFGGQQAAVMTGIPSDDAVGFTAHVLSGVGADGFAGVSLVNPSDLTETRVSLEYFNQAGLQVTKRQVTLLPGEKRAFLLNDLLDPSLLSLSLWVRLTSNRAITGFVVWGTNPAEGNLGGGLAGSGSLLSVLPYCDANSRIYMANPSSFANRITLNFYSPDGSLMESEVLNLEAMERRVLPRKTGPGSVRAEGTSPLLLGSDYAFRRSDGGLLSESLPGITAPDDAFAVAHIASNDQWETELLLANAGNRLVDVALEGYSSAGELISTVSLPLDAFASVRTSILNLFGSTSRKRIAWLRLQGVKGSQLAGFVWFYGSNQNLPVMGGVPMTPLP